MITFKSIDETSTDRFYRSNCDQLYVMHCGMLVRHVSCNTLVQLPGSAQKGAKELGNMVFVWLNMVLAWFLYIAI